MDEGWERGGQRADERWMKGGKMVKERSGGEEVEEAW